MRFALSAVFFSIWTLAAQQQGSIDGQILNATTGAPVKKAMVNLSGDFAAQGNERNRGNSTQGQETDAQGRFQFTGLPPGQYQLSAQRAGFLQQNYGARHANTQGKPIAVGPSQQITDVTLRLTPQGVIVGRVLDEDGDPVAFAQILIFKQMYRSGKRQWTQANGANTSDIGEYRASGLEPGRYLVAAVSRPPVFDTIPGESLPQKPEMIYAATYYPNGLTEQSGAPVEVTAGSEMRGIDIHLTKVPSFRVRGTVNGIPQVTSQNFRGGPSVSLFRRDGSYTNPSNAQVHENQFELRNVTPGQYTILVRAGGGLPLTASQPIVVGSGHLTGLVLTLAPALDLAGQVRVAEAGGTVSLKNVTATLRPADMVFMAGPMMAQADAEGRVSFKNVSPGTYLVDVQNVPDGCFVQSVKYGGQEVTRDGVEIASPALLEVILSSTAAKISGSVTDKDGKPVSGSTVALIPSDANSQIEAVTTDDTGNFAFGRLRPGTYHLLAWEDVEWGAYEDPEFRKPFDSQAVEIKVGPSEQQNAQLRVISAEEMPVAR